MNRSAHTWAVSAAAALVVILSGPLALAAPADLLLVSVAADGSSKANANSRLPSVSADGSRVVFESVATNLDPADTDTLSDVYVRELTTSQVILVSRGELGAKGNGDSYDASISADGTRVAFVSRATNLDSDDTDELADVYVSVLDSGGLFLASTGSGGSPKADGDSFRPTLSSDGSRVAFDSVATNLDPDDADNLSDVYVMNLNSGELLLASTSETGIKGNGASSAPSLSADGSHVAFQSDAGNLNPADTSSDTDVYVKYLATGECRLASTTSAGVKGNNSSGLPSLSADGSIVAFESNATTLDPSDTDTFTDIYVKELSGTGALTLVSTDPAGNKGNANSGDLTLTNAPELSLSGDGTHVAFVSRATNLHPDDVDSFVDVYVKDLATGALLLASSAADGTKGNDNSLHPSITADGGAVAFDFNGDNLDPLDADTVIDVYLKGASLDDTPRLEGDGTVDVRRVAIQVCQVLFTAPDQARSVILARDDVFADALAGAPLAGDDSCVLYTTGGAGQPLDAVTRAEIDRALPAGGPVRILGGALAVSAEVESELTAAGYAVERFQGDSRFETAVAIARVVRAENPGGTDALLAYGLNFPDAVTGGAYGARTGTPILLTDTPSLHPATAAAMTELSVQRTFVLGGTAVISEAAAAQAPDPRRIAGDNRMGTAAAVAATLWPASVPTVSTVVLCNIERSDGWALTLAAAPLSAREGAPQLGVGTDTYPTETQTYLQGLAPRADTAYVMGNVDFISDAVVASAEADLA